MSFIPNGNEFRTVSIELSIIKRGIPSFDIYGIPIKLGNLMKLRIKNAILNSGFGFPSAKVSVAFSSYANTYENYFDLGIAVALVTLSQGYTYSDKICYFGELESNGAVKLANFTDLYYQFARDNCYQCLLSNANGVALDYDNECQFFRATTLSEAVLFSQNKIHLQKIEVLNASTSNAITELKPIFGNYKAKRCLELCVAGQHPMLLIGPPGVGKTSLVKFIPFLLPSSLENEAIYVRQNMIYGKYTNSNYVPIIDPPLSVTVEKLFGKSSNEASALILQANNGFLFMDEFTEFSRKHLECLKKVIDEKSVGNFKCDFTLIAACNPCNCGNFGSSTSKCVCSVHQRKKYRQKLSAGLLDRFHLMTYIDTSDAKPSQSDVLEFDWVTKIKTRIKSAKPLPETITITDINCEKLLSKAVATYSLSTRAVQNLISVAKTIASLEQCTDIKTEHLLEALSFRPNFYEV